MRSAQHRGRPTRHRPASVADSNGHLSHRRAAECPQWRACRSSRSWPPSPRRSSISGSSRSRACCSRGRPSFGGSGSAQRRTRRSCGRWRSTRASTTCSSRRGSWWASCSWLPGSGTRGGPSSCSPAPAWWVPASCCSRPTGASSRRRRSRPGRRSLRSWRPRPVGMPLAAEPARGAVYAARTMTAPIGAAAQNAWLASLFDITG